MLSTELRRQLEEGDSFERVVKALIDQAASGNMAAIRTILDRIDGPMNTITIEDDRETVAHMTDEELMEAFMLLRASSLPYDPKTLTDDERDARTVEIFEGAKMRRVATFGLQQIAT